MCAHGAAAAHCAPSSSTPPRNLCRVYERGVALFKYPHVKDIWQAYLAFFNQRYGGRKVERARDLYRQAIDEVGGGCQWHGWAGGGGVQGDGQAGACCMLATQRTDPLPGTRGPSPCLWPPLVGRLPIASRCDGWWRAAVPGCEGGQERALGTWVLVAPLRAHGRPVPIASSLTQAPPEESKPLFLQYAAYEEKHGLAKNAMQVGICAVDFPLPLWLMRTAPGAGYVRVLSLPCRASVLARSHSRPPAADLRRSCSEGAHRRAPPRVRRLPGAGI